MYSAAAAPIILTAPAAALTNAPPAALTGAAAPLAALPSPPTLPIRPPIPPAMDDIPPMTLPPTTSRGPATAAIPATLMIVSCISGDRPFHASVSWWMASDAPLANSEIIGPAAVTMSAPRIFSSFSVVWKSSIGDSVPSNALLTVPLVSDAASPRLLKSIVPFLTAP